MHLHFDSLVAGYTAKGEWRFDTEHLHKRKLRELAQAAEAIRPGMLQFHHVKAHSGQPCNELARLCETGHTKRWQESQQVSQLEPAFPEGRPYTDVDLVVS